MPCGEVGIVSLATGHPAAGIDCSLVPKKTLAIAVLLAVAMIGGVEAVGLWKCQAPLQVCAPCPVIEGCLESCQNPEKMLNLHFSIIALIRD